VTVLLGTGSVRSEVMFLNPNEGRVSIINNSGLIVGLLFDTKKIATVDYKI
jgi:hypothetical protein